MWPNSFGLLHLSSNDCSWIASAIPSPESAHFNYPHVRHLWRKETIKWVPLPSGFRGISSAPEAEKKIFSKNIRRNCCFIWCARCTFHRWSFESWSIWNVRRRLAVNEIPRSSVQWSRWFVLNEHLQVSSCTVERFVYHGQLWALQNVGSRDITYTDCQAFGYASKFSTEPPGPLCLKRML